MYSIGKKIPLVGAINPEKTPFVGQINPFMVSRLGGFTMVELIVTLAVAALLVALAIPNLRTAIQNNRIRANTNDFISDMTYARSEALKRGTNIGICRVADAQAVLQCDGANWAGDRMIFADTNNDGALTGGEMVLRVRERMPNNTLTSVDAPHPLIINSRGLLANVAAPVNFSLCDDRGASHGRAIQITLTGQVNATPNPGGC